MRSSSRQIPLPVKTAIHWLVPIRSLCDGDVHSQRPWYRFGYLSYVNSPLWVMAQQLLPPCSAPETVAQLKNNRLFSQFWSAGWLRDSVITTMKQRRMCQVARSLSRLLIFLSLIRPGRCKRGLQRLFIIKNMGIDPIISKEDIQYEQQRTYMNCTVWDTAATCACWLNVASLKSSGTVSTINKLVLAPNKLI